MAEQNQSQEPKLEDILLSINGFNGLLSEFDKNKTSKEQAVLYDRAAQMISGGQKEGEEGYNKAWSQLTRDPAQAFMEVQKYRKLLASQYTELYEKSKENIKEHIESKINESLKIAGNHQGNAASILTNYLFDVIHVEKLTQEQVDEMERQKVLSMGLGYAGIIESKKTAEQYRHAEIRKEASKYLKAVKQKGKVTGYVIDSEKLDEAMKDMTKAASIYGRIIEKAKETENVQK